MATSDIIAKDGTMHILNDVLIPPKKPGSIKVEDPQQFTVEELIERLDKYIDDESTEEDTRYKRIEL